MRRRTGKSDFGKACKDACFVVSFSTRELLKAAGTPLSKHGVWARDGCLSLTSYYSWNTRKHFEGPTRTSSLSDRFSFLFEGVVISSWIVLMTVARGG